MKMSNVFPTTGGIRIGLDVEYIIIEQERFEGGEKHVIRMPHSLLVPFLDALFTQMHMSDFDELADLCIFHKDMQHQAIRDFLDKEKLG